MQRQRLIIFVKAPRAGFVKTRLARAIGAAAACEAYRKLLGCVFAQMDSVRDVELRFSPDDAEEEIKPWLKEGWTTAGQGEGDLGERLAHAFAEAFANGFTQVAAIGSDCPEVTVDDVSQGWRALGRHDVVLGPAADGGYWLIGLKAGMDGIFEKIDWSTSRVLEQTLDWVKANGKSCHLLRELRDVDTEEDWKSFLKRK